MTITNAAAQHTSGITHAIAANTDRALQAGSHVALDAMDSLRSSSRQLRHALLDSRDGTLRYVRHEPAKAIMIAVAAGIVVAGLAALLSQLLRDRD